MSGPVSGPKGGSGEEAHIVEKAGNTGPINPAGSQNSDSQTAALAAALNAISEAASEVTPDEVDQETLESKEQNPDDPSAPVSRDGDASSGGGGGGSREEPPAPLEDEKITFNLFSHTAPSGGKDPAPPAPPSPESREPVTPPPGAGTSSTVQSSQGESDDGYSWFGQIGQSGASYYSQFLSDMLQAYTQATNQTLEQAVNSGNLSLTAAESQADATRAAGRTEANKLQLQSYQAFATAGTTALTTGAGEYAGRSAANQAKTEADQAQIENRQMDHTELAIRNANKTPASDSVAGVNAQGNRLESNQLNKRAETQPTDGSNRLYVEGDSYDPYRAELTPPRSKEQQQAQDPTLEMQFKDENGIMIAEGGTGPYSKNVTYANGKTGAEEQAADINKLLKGESLDATLPTSSTQGGTATQTSNLSDNEIIQLKTSRAMDGMAPEQKAQVQGRQNAEDDIKLLLDGKSPNAPVNDQLVPVNSKGEPLQGPALSKAQEEAAVSYMTPQEKVQYQSKKDPYMAQARKEDAASVAAGDPPKTEAELRVDARRHAQGDIDTMLKKGVIPGSGKGGKEPEMTLPSGEVVPATEKKGWFGSEKTPVSEEQTLAMRSEAAVNYMEPHERAELQTTINNKRPANEGIIASGNNKAAHLQRWTMLAGAMSESIKGIIQGTVAQIQAPLEVEQAAQQAEAAQYGASLSVAQQQVQAFNQQLSSLFQAMASAINAYNSANGSNAA